VNSAKNSLRVMIEHWLSPDPANGVRALALMEIDPRLLTEIDPLGCRTIACATKISRSASCQRSQHDLKVNLVAKGLIAGHCRVATIRSGPCAQSLLVGARSG
jgi:hypothetical protein